MISCDLKVCSKFSKVPNALTTLRISDTSKIVYMYLLSKQRDYTLIQRNIANDLNLSLSTIQVSMRELKDNDLLSTSVDNTNGTNLTKYTLTFPMYKTKYNDYKLNLPSIDTNFIKVPNKLIIDSEINCHEKVLLLHLLSKPANYNIVQKNIGAELGKTKGSINRIIKQLKEKGYLVVKKYYKGTTACFNYCLNLYRYCNNKIKSTNKVKTESKPSVKQIHFAKLLGVKQQFIKKCTYQTLDREIKKYLNKPSKKQLKYATHLGIDTTNISKKELSKLIKIELKQTSTSSNYSEPVWEKVELRDDMITCDVLEKMLNVEGAIMT